MQDRYSTDEDLDRLARRRAGAKLGWFVHATVYVLVNILMFYIATTKGTGRWNIYPAMGWGLGLAMHGLGVFVLGPGSSLRENMIRRERERLEQERNRRP